MVETRPITCEPKLPQCSPTYAQCSVGEMTPREKVFKCGPTVDHGT